MEGKVQVLKELKGKLTGYVQDRDVFLFEQIRKYQQESFIFDVLKIVYQDKACTAQLWEVIADVCFEKLGQYGKLDDDKRIEATNILAAYRQFLKANAIQLTNQDQHIPDDILVFDRNERNRMESKLRNQLYGIDLKVVSCRNEDELRVAEKDAITLVSMIKKRIEQLEQSKVKMKYHEKIFRDPFLKTQMIKLSVVRYEKITREGIALEDSRIVFTKTLPFKKSDKKTITAVNEILLKINEEFNLKQPLYKF